MFFRASELNAGLTGFVSIGHYSAEQMKEELGLDHFEGRPWLELHHHLTLCFMAYSFLTLLRYQSKDKKILMTLSQGR
ncbi:hypothetical protein NEOC65_001858 [Neochlamydia sp. AcF65]|nr:hypothetical protein [Neochlamydia sp. AcF65]